MKNLCSLVLLVGLGMTRLIGAEMNQAVEDELDAITQPEKAKTEQATVSNENGEPRENAFAKLIMPENPSKTDVLNYLDMIIDTIEPIKGKTTRYRVTDLERIYDSIPSTYLKEMLKAHANIRIGPLPKSFIETSVNKRSDLDDTHRAVILKYLPNFPGLITTVTRNGWEKGQEAIMIKVVQQGGFLPLAQYVAVLAAYGTPRANAQLIELATKRPPDTQAVFMIELYKVETKGLDRDALLKKVWASVQQSGASNVAVVAPLAAKQGYSDALMYMAKRLNNLPNAFDPNDMKVRLDFLDALQQLVPDGGSDEKSLVKFVLTNRTKLIFDKSLKEYRLPTP